MKYKILQIKDIRNVDYSFMRYDFAKNNGFNLNDYEVVYESNLNVLGLCIDEILEKLFYILNMERPSDFKGHSLSVSDIVEVSNRRFYVDSFGFKEII